MTTVTMFTPTDVPDAWHAVTAPGGYEWWYFDAEDAATDLRVVAILFQGFVFHPGYLRAYDRYRRQPTRVVPPTPRQYPCAYFVVYQGGKVAAQFMHQYTPEQFAAAADRVDVAVGPNRLTCDADGALRLSLAGVPWVLTGRGPQRLVGRELSATLTFRPKPAGPPMQRRFFDRSWSGADHHWVLANPLCTVAADVRLTGSPDRTFALAGRGYHDHNYGTGPIGTGLSRWMWGRVLVGDDHAVLFHVAEPRDPAVPAELHLVEVDAFGSRELPDPPYSADWDRRTATLLRYPGSLSIGPLSLRDPIVVDASPFYLRVAYAGSLRGRPCTAFCEVAYPHRLRWPVLGRMIEMSIGRSG